MQPPRTLSRSCTPVFPSMMPGLRPQQSARRLPGSGFFSSLSSTPRHHPHRYTFPLIGTTLARLRGSSSIPIFQRTFSSRPSVTCRRLQGTVAETSTSPRPITSTRVSRVYRGVGVLITGGFVFHQIRKNSVQCASSSSEQKILSANEFNKAFESAINDNSIEAIERLIHSIRNIKDDSGEQHQFNQDQIKAVFTLGNLNLIKELLKEIKIYQHLAQKVLPIDPYQVFYALNTKKMTPLQELEISQIFISLIKVGDRSLSLRNQSIMELILKAVYDAPYGGTFWGRFAYFAIESDKWEDLKDLLERKIITADTKHKNTTPFFDIACENGSKEIVKLFLVQDIDINQDDGRALRIAVKKDRREIVETLIESGAKLNVQRYHPPLTYLAITNRNEDLALYLMDKGARIPCLSNYIYDEKSINEVMKLRLFKVLEKILENTLKMGERNLNFTLLANAVTVDCTVVKFLLDHGATKEMINFKSCERTPLLYAIGRGDLISVEYLVEAGADLTGSFHPLDFNKPMSYLEYAEERAKESGDYRILNYIKTKMK